MIQLRDRSLEFHIITPGKYNRYNFPFQAMLKPPLAHQAPIYHPLIQYPYIYIPFLSNTGCQCPNFPV